MPFVNAHMMHNACMAEFEETLRGKLMKKSMTVPHWTQLLGCLSDEAQIS
jgi:hypothetical protein